MCLLASATSVAMAQSPDLSEAPLDADVATATEPSAKQPAIRYPRRIIDRPFTYPKGLAAVGFDASTLTTSSTFLSPALIRGLVGYGITDDLEIGFGRYAFATNAPGKGSIDVTIGYTLLRGAAGGKVDVIGRVQTGYNLAREGMSPLQIGAQAGYLITPSFAVFSPGLMLSFALSGETKPITLSVPMSAGVQATETVWIELGAVLADLSISKSSNTFILADSTPLTLSGYLTIVPALDAILSVTANLTPPAVTVGATTMSPGIADTIELMVGARYYIGRL